MMVSATLPDFGKATGAGWITTIDGTGSTTGTFVTTAAITMTTVAAITTTAIATKSLNPCALRLLAGRKPAVHQLQPLNSPKFHFFNFFSGETSARSMRLSNISRETNADWV